MFRGQKKHTSSGQLCVIVRMYVKIDVIADVDIMKEKIEIVICLHDALFFAIKFKMTQKN